MSVKLNKEVIRQAVPISKVLNHYDVRRKHGDAWFCFGHDDKHASLVANDQRGFATCLSSKCSLPSGMDIFNIINHFEGGGFQDALLRAAEIGGLHHGQISLNSTTPSRNKRQGDFIKANSPKKERPLNTLTEIPKLSELDKAHTDWLSNRYDSEWPWLVREFQLKARYKHIAVPISSDSYSFIPLDKEKDSPYYLGRVRTNQVYPQLPLNPLYEHVVVVKGEKDVFRVALHLHQHNQYGRWAVITNTNGAHALKEDLPLFNQFNPQQIESVTIAYDNDDAGKRANDLAFSMAQAYFPEEVTIEIIDFTSSVKGYDMSDWLDDGHYLLPAHLRENGANKTIDVQTSLNF